MRKKDKDKKKDKHDSDSDDDFYERTKKKVTKSLQKSAKEGMDWYHQQKDGGAKTVSKKKIEKQMNRFFACNLARYKDPDLKCANIAAWKEQFTAMDIDGNGKISQKELGILLKSNSNLNDADAKRYIQGYLRLDKKSQKEKIDFFGFLKEFSKMQNFIVMRKIQKLFAEHDENQDGVLSKEEYFKLLESIMGREVAINQSDALFASVDKDASGGVSITELAEWYFTTIVNGEGVEEQKTEQTLPTLEQQPTMNIIESIQDEHEAASGLQADRHAAQKADQEAKLQAALDARAQGRI